MVSVAWNKERCSEPRGCAKCLNACPNGVLSMYGAGRQPGVKENSWSIAPLFLALCDGCGLCASACSDGAIAVTNGHC